MNKFYVNEIHDDVLNRIRPRNSIVVGLFKQCRTDGRGSFCGYYATEYYLNTEMYAYYFADSTGRRYTTETRISEVFVCDPPVKYKDARIATHMWTNVIEADTIVEAIERFENADWRRWISPFDEPGMCTIHHCPKCGKLPSAYAMGAPDIKGLLEVFACHKCGIRAESLNGQKDAAEKWNKYVSRLKGE